MQRIGTAAPTSPTPWIVVIVLSAVYFAAGIAAVTGDVNSTFVKGTLGIALAATLVLLAVTRFWAFLLVLIALRSALDGIQSGSGGGVGQLDPGTIVGAVFLVAGIAWLLVQWRSGQLLPVSRTAKFFSIFLLTLVISSFGAVSVKDSFLDSTRVMSAVVLLVVFEQIFARNPERLKAVLAALFASLLIPITVGAWQAIHSSPSAGFNASTLSRVDGTFVHPNAFATYLVTMALLAMGIYKHMSSAWRRVLMVVVIAVIPMIILTYARGAWIGLCIGLFYLGFVQSPRLAAALLATIAIVIIAVPSVSNRLADLGSSETLHFGSASVVEPNSLSWRVQYWGRIIPDVGQNPGTGIGFGMVQQTRPEHEPPHNVFVEALVEAGIAGLIAFVAFLVTLGFDLRLARRRARRGLAGGMTVAVIACSLAMFSQLFSENLLSGSILWYYFTPVAWVLAVAARPAPLRPANNEEPALARVP
jgi:O-antigen ligase